MKIRWPWQRKEETRITNLRAVRIEKRVVMPGFQELGDIEFNKRRAAALSQQAKQKEDG